MRVNFISSKDTGETRIIYVWSDNANIMWDGDTDDIVRETFRPLFLAQNANLNHLVEPSFQGINRFFVLAFENDAQRTSNKRYDVLNVEIKDYNVMIDGKNFFDKPVKNDKATYENIRKISTGQGDDYATGCLLDYTYIKKYYKMIAIDLSKQQALDADPKAIQQIQFNY